jgi:hypothetical protein
MTTKTAAYERTQITNPLDVAAFAFAGKAIFTLVGKAGRFTYKVAKSDDGKLYFVSLFTGSDNADKFAYEYVGIVRTYQSADVKDWEFEQTSKARITPSDPKWGKAITGFAWFLKEVKKAQMIEEPHTLGQAEFWHEGRCGRCGARLTVPESIARGLGPECTKLGAK